MRTSAHARQRLLWGLVLATVVAVLPAGAAAAAEAEPRGTEDACSYAPASAFTDRPADALGEAVDCVAFYGVTAGTTPTAYQPHLPVTRGQMATFLVRAAEVAGTTLPPVEASSFPDDAGTAHEAATDRLHAAGVATGFADGTFRPATPVTRGQMATFLARTLALVTTEDLPEAPEDHFSDDDGTAHEAATNALAQLGVVVGAAEGTYAPAATVSRGQLALLLSRSMDWLTSDRQVPLARLAPSDPSDRPTLLGVEVTPAGEVTTVSFAFDEPVAPSPIALEAFAALSYSGEATAPTSAVRDQGRTHVVHAAFPTAVTRLATTAAVARGAVEDSAGTPSAEGDAPLRAVELLPGTTSAPDLVSVSRLGAAAIDFNFDEPAYVLDGTGYRLVLADGTVKRSTSATGNGTSTHTVSFPIDTEESTQVVRGAVVPGAVADQPKGASSTGRFANPQQTVGIAQGGRLEAVPDLVAVAVDAEADVVRYTFDEAVELVAGSQARWRTYDLDGREATSRDAAALEDDDRTIAVTFAPGQVSRLSSGASVDAGVVRSPVTEAANHLDEAPFARRFEAGETAAPDLVRVGRLARTGTGGASVRGLSFEFDQRLILESPGGFSMYGADGSRVVLGGCAPATERSVVCSVDAATNPERHAAMGTAVLAGVEPGAVSDVNRARSNHAAAAPL